MPDPSVHSDLLQGGWADKPFAPFHGGIEICVLQDGAPRVALLRYAAGARAPLHRHPGLETVLVLEGSQTDENGHYPTGSFVLNPPGTQHSVWSDEGCVVLIQWTEPVVFLESA
ncbi:allophanate hydrolase [Oceanicola sp. 22II-s10i]|uniref:cupin domain-containing protein n=1 Tax=Oceanicola sp. 22II-s10i TaxID=1317116 RepID=UPI000B523B40|nr:cupin domain-containing protein [Oceanicola sp. 22II-s10i]OWU84389.1 allophanate hydrolase [Oceanicola sp. 22II-s10i]